MERRVVITGMGVISPIGNDVQTFWNNLINGVCGIDTITNISTDDLPVKIAGEVKDFDATKYGIDASTVRKNDRYALFALAAANQAMRQSGLEMDPERLGVYVGSGVGGIQTLVNETTKLNNEGAKWISPLFVPMMIANIASGNIAIAHNAQGVCLPVVSACATGTNSIGEAFHAIKYGYADAIIAGGAEAAVCPLAIGGFANSKALSRCEDPKKASLPFDKRRQGFVLAEGAGIVVLEEYEHAALRGAQIFAEICGYGNSCDAYHYTAPRPDGSAAARSIKLALQEANYQENDIVHINAHGTGTPLNDKSETLAIKLALGETAARRAAICSTKSMTGHLLGAAGGVEVIAAALALKEGIIPPTIGYSEPDPDCDLDYTPNKARKLNATLALSNSLGFGGHNACIALR
ncbi:MAG: beta-ketoacyl-ACP synthase II [Bacteroidales bacterium]|jgi:3-oxoacyl-[acyl-carrier-protein] synthase II|nr:beta-ketoacyl-ACP synthase II [Bacteroidales bacterium]MDD3201022.1 beta-ketoacyl-ACP synthase II [Bacteroidales bacterium]